MRRWLKRICLLALVLTMVPAGVIGWLGSELLVAPERRGLQDFHRKILADPEGYGLAEPVSFTGPRDAPCQIYLPSRMPAEARKSRALRASLVKRGVDVPAWGETVGTLILLHGRLGRKEDHLPIAERFCAAGFACIVWDLPAHGDSPCAHFTFGAKECGEVHKLLEAARKTVPLTGPVGLFGVSQGGAIALQCTHGNDAFYAVASVASFAELEPLVRESAKRLAPVLGPFSGATTLLVRAGTRMRAGFDPASIRPVTAAATIDVPVFIGHGVKDRFISTSHAQQIFDAVPHSKKTLVLVPEGTHGNVLAKGGNAFYADIAEFFLQHLPASTTRKALR